MIDESLWKKPFGRCRFPFAPLVFSCSSASRNESRPRHHILTCADVLFLSPRRAFFFRRIQIGGQTAIDQDFLPTVTASCQGGQMTIRVETRQSFQGKREKPVRRIPKTRSRPALRKRMVASVFFNRIRPRLDTSRTWVESSMVNLVRSYSCSPF